MRTFYYALQKGFLPSEVHDTYEFAGVISAIFVQCDFTLFLCLSKLDVMISTSRRQFPCNDQFLGLEDKMVSVLNSIPTDSFYY